MNRFFFSARGWLWIIYLICVVLILNWMGLYDGAKGAELPKFEIVDPICPTRLYISQEYLTWCRVNGRTVVVDRTVITKCYTQPKIVYRASADKGAKRENQTPGTH